MPPIIVLKNSPFNKNIFKENTKEKMKAYQKKSLMK